MPIKKYSSKKSIGSIKKYIKNNIIFTFTHPTKLNEDKKIKLMLATFKTFLDNYCTKIKKKVPSFPLLKIDKTELIKKQNNTNTFYMFIYTKPYNNHPFLVYGNLFKLEYKIVIPFGDKKGQVDINKYLSHINGFTTDEKLAIKHLTNRTMIIRKENLLLNSKYSILNCENIGECIKKVKSIEKTKLAKITKDKQILIVRKYYKDKALKLLNIYFNLLATNKFDEAKYFLEGKRLNKKYPQYKLRLGEFFSHKEDIIGHLKIFIPLYKLSNVL